MIEDANFERRPRAERPKKRANQSALQCGAYRLPVEKPPTEGVGARRVYGGKSPRAHSSPLLRLEVVFESRRA